MGEKTSDRKVIFTEEIKCPHCKKFIEVEKTKVTLTEAVKGEYEEFVVAKKSKQSRLKN